MQSQRKALFERTKSSKAILSFIELDGQIMRLALVVGFLDIRKHTDFNRNPENTVHGCRAVSLLQIGAKRFVVRAPEFVDYVLFHKK